MRNDTAPEPVAAEILALLKPPARQRDDCQRHIDDALTVMAATKRAAEHGGTKKASVAYDGVLRRFLAASRAYHAAGGAPALAVKRLESATSFHEQWQAHWRPLAPAAVQRQAAHLAYRLLQRWDRATAPVTTKHGKWFRLAALLYGDPAADLTRHLQAFRKENAGQDSLPSKVMRARV